ncbi:transcriptional regulator, partial [Salmonella enterica]|nr:transcriptional regulator [Salmonella enterica]EFQ6101188.1 transcriptional regulator [Salmonella enterica subsp. enterica serovar Kentucky]EGJ3317691.1 transcriptional regulator [Salmonella enterica subsp. enterica serovar Heidelberg]EGY1653116.1 transcriptional regulator [Salmonella enterica subsp. enterica serovar Cerro]EIV1283485.1 transcriptional regulator [Salmonella enterica subsp. enterica serovar Putten]HAF7363630.1 transcriptional regulator [Salmonella enterica subsp. enterica ser
ISIGIPTLFLLIVLFFLAPFI